jgi:hypothetical protein
VRQAANESSGQIQPKLVAPNNDSAGQSASVMDRSSRDVDSEADRTRQCHKAMPERIRISSTPDTVELARKERSPWRLI